MSPNARTHTPSGVAIVAHSGPQRPCFGPEPSGTPR
jgi:hypothetical protein